MLSIIHLPTATRRHNNFNRAAVSSENVTDQCITYAANDLLLYILYIYVLYPIYMRRVAQR